MKQRNKAELLQNLLAYESLKKDNHEISKKQGYWRMAVEWSHILWKEEKWSSEAIADFLEYVNTHDVTDLPEERRSEIRGLIEGKTAWTVAGGIQRQKQKNKVDDAVNEFVSNVTRTNIDYSLLASEYLLTHGYARKRMNRVIRSVYFADKMEPATIMQMRQELFEHKGIWVELDGDIPPEDARII